jgi:hypothetical protein
VTIKAHAADWRGAPRGRPRRSSRRDASGAFSSWRCFSSGMMFGRVYPGATLRHGSCSVRRSAISIYERLPIEHSFNEHFGGATTQFPYTRVSTSNQTVAHQLQQAALPGSISTRTTSSTMRAFRASAPASRRGMAAGACSTSGPKVVVAVSGIMRALFEVGRIFLVRDQQTCRGRMGFRDFIARFEKSPRSVMLNNWRIPFGRTVSYQLSALRRACSCEGRWP